MTHWELQACVDDFIDEHKVAPNLEYPTDEEFDEWVHGENPEP